MYFLTALKTLRVVKGGVKVRVTMSIIFSASSAFMPELRSEARIFRLLYASVSPDSLSILKSDMPLIFRFLGHGFACGVGEFKGYDC